MKLNIFEVRVNPYYRILFQMSMEHNMNQSMRDKEIGELQLQLAETDKLTSDVVSSVFCNCCDCCHLDCPKILDV